MKYKKAKLTPLSPIFLHISPSLQLFFHDVTVMEAVPAVSGIKATFRSIKDTVNLVTVGWRSLETRRIDSQVEMF